MKTVFPFQCDLHHCGCSHINISAEGRAVEYYNMYKIAVALTPNSKLVLGTQYVLILLLNVN